MQTFYETQACAHRRIKQDLSYHVDFCWSTFIDGGKGVPDVSRPTGEDSSFYGEDDHPYEPYRSDESDSVFKEQTHLQAQCSSGESFESMCEFPIQTAWFSAQPSLPGSTCYETSGKRPASFGPSAKRLLDIERRNSRERIRVRAVNEAFVRLRRLVPSTRAAAKRVSKRSTLVRAAEYIRELQQRLADAALPTAQHKPVPVNGGSIGSIGSIASTIRPSAL